MHEFHVVLCHVFAAGRRTIRTRDTCCGCPHMTSRRRRSPVPLVAEQRHAVPLVGQHPVERLPPPPPAANHLRGAGSVGVWLYLGDSPHSRRRCIRSAHHTSHLFTAVGELVHTHLALPVQRPIAYPVPPEDHPLQAGRRVWLVSVVRTRETSEQPCGCVSLAGCLACRRTR